MAAAPKFALFVSSVSGRLASRPGSPHTYIGARLPSPEERKAGSSEPVWNPDEIVPILESEYKDPRFLRHWDGMIRDGDLLSRTEAEWQAYVQGLEKVEVERTKKLEAESRKAKTEAAGGKE
jgi:hypothetical protein